MKEEDEGEEGKKNPNEIEFNQKLFQKQKQFRFCLLHLLSNGAKSE